MAQLYNGNTTTTLKVGAFSNCTCEMNTYAVFWDQGFILSHTSCFNKVVCRKG